VLQWIYEEQLVQVPDSFRYLRVWLHSTKGLSVARDAFIESSGTMGYVGYAGEVTAYAVA
jgi:hypothetical protein